MSDARRMRRRVCGVLASPLKRGARGGGGPRGTAIPCSPKEQSPPCRHGKELNSIVRAPRSVEAITLRRDTPPHPGAGRDTQCANPRPNKPSHLIPIPHTAPPIRNCQSAIRIPPTRGGEIDGIPYGVPERSETPRVDGYRPVYPGPLPLDPPAPWTPQVDPLSPKPLLDPGTGRQGISLGYVRSSKQEPRVPGPHGRILLPTPPENHSRGQHASSRRPRRRKNTSPYPFGSITEFKIRWWG